MLAGDRETAPYLQSGQGTSMKSMFVKKWPGRWPPRGCDVQRPLVRTCVVTPRRANGKEWAAAHKNHREILRPWLYSCPGMVSEPASPTEGAERELDEEPLAQWPKSPEEKNETRFTAATLKVDRPNSN